MSLNQNQFKQSVVLGQIDLGLPAGQTIAVQIDSTQVGDVLPGQPMKRVSQTGSALPKVVKATSQDDEVYCYIPYNQKEQKYVAGDRVEAVGPGGGVLYLRATEAIEAGAHLMIDPAQLGGVATVTAGKHIIGHAYDGAAADGDLIRVWTFLPAAFKA